MQASFILPEGMSKNAAAQFVMGAVLAAMEAHPDHEFDAESIQVIAFATP
jgi:hypothetical protein